jgi:hypothetical protein
MPAPFLFSDFERRLSLTAFCHRAFKDVVFEPLKESLVSGVHDIAGRDRRGEVVDR